MNLAACGSLPRTPENGVWYRCIIPANLSTALSSAHTKKTATRFNPGALLAPADQYATLHFADDPVVALFETGSLLGKLNPGYHVPHPRMTQVTLNVHVILRDVIDLTDVSHAQVPLGTNAQELTGDWESYQIRDHRTPVSHTQPELRLRRNSDGLSSRPAWKDFGRFPRKCPITRRSSYSPTTSEKAAHWTSRTQAAPSRIESRRSYPFRFTRAGRSQDASRRRCESGEGLHAFPHPEFPRKSAGSRASCDSP